MLDSIKPLIEKTKRKCPFCNAHIMEVTPKFVGIRERFVKGSSVIFPNLYPFSVFHGVAPLSPKLHYVPLNKITPKLIRDSIENSIDFFSEANRKSPSFKYPSINFNYMPPAAASIMHPHLQLILDSMPTFMTNLLITKSLSHYRKYKENFWSELVSVEKKEKERYIGETGCFSWIADFAPLKNNQIAGICKGISSLDQMGPKHLRDMANGLSKVFNKLWMSGVRSINMAIYSSQMGEDASDYFLLNLKIISRPVLTKYYVSDFGFMEFMHQEPVIETLPENVAKSLKLV